MTARRAVRLARTLGVLACLTLLGVGCATLAGKVVPGPLVLAPIFLGVAAVVASLYAWDEAA